MTNAVHGTLWDFEIDFDHQFTLRTTLANSCLNMVSTFSPEDAEVSKYMYPCLVAHSLPSLSLTMRLLRSVLLAHTAISIFFFPVGKVR
jgi:hypothetical protein